MKHLFMTITLCGMGCVPGAITGVDMGLLMAAGGALVLLATCLPILLLRQSLPPVPGTGDAKGGEDTRVRQEMMAIPGRFGEQGGRPGMPFSSASNRKER